MSYNFHHCTLILKLLQLILFNDFSFDLLYSNSSMLPSASVDYAVASFRDFAVELQISIIYLIIGLKRLNICHHRHLVLIHQLLYLLLILLNLLFYIVLVGSWVLKLWDHSPLFRGEHFQDGFFIVVKAVIVVAVIWILGGFPFWCPFQYQLLSQSLDLPFQLLNSFNVRTELIIVLKLVDFYFFLLLLS